jgi:sirohydrochlorin ferrochelatase
VTHSSSVFPQRRPKRTSAPEIAGVRGLVVIGHGTLDVRGKAEFLETAAQLAHQLPQWVVEPAYLEMAAPNLAVAVERALTRGATSVQVLPLLLFAAGHAKLDLPQLVDQIVADHPALGLEQGAVLSCQADLVALSALRFCEALNFDPAFPAEETLLMLVGRGSRDEQARRDMLHFAQLRRQRTPVGGLEICFLAMSEPGLEETLSRTSQSAYRQIVVQPHLLFHGALHDRILSAVGRCRIQSPDKLWVCAEPLGPHPLLVSAALESAGLVAGRDH